MRIILKVLGFVDFLALILLFLSPWFPDQFVRYGAYWLIIKGGFFFLTSKDIASLVDMLAGFYIILLTVGIGVDFLTVGVLVFLGLKAGMSVFL